MALSEPPRGVAIEGVEVLKRLVKRLLRRGGIPPRRPNDRPELPTVIAIDVCGPLQAVELIVKYQPDVTPH